MMITGKPSGNKARRSDLIRVGQLAFGRLGMPMTSDAITQ